MSSSPPSTRSCPPSTRRPRRTMSGEGMAAVRQKSRPSLVAMFQRPHTEPSPSRSSFRRASSMRMMFGGRNNNNDNNNSEQQDQSSMELHLEDLSNSSSSNINNQSFSSLHGSSSSNLGESSCSSRPERRRRRPKRSVSGPVHRLPSRSKSGSFMMSPFGKNDADTKAMDELDVLTRELERMASALERVDCPEKILLKHMAKQNAAFNVAA
ncbi:expressed unknown protein [Seminavis robusta]|uniref:Uncharacterized protein n=1 Tax=Seminavis robusta TaxID=568900 RepID=A0A9N8H7T7_9STRA|nr:expressed unknown protein [Seminavis robusta]|eukprot:Sro149_g068710.1 n/a (211) ;mRNA; f:100874-101506